MTTDPESFVRKLVAVLKAEMQAKTLVHDKLGCFALWLRERRCEMETAVHNAIVRVEADALASAMRKASDECSQLKRECETYVQRMACGMHFGRAAAKSKIPFNANDDKLVEKDARKTLIEELEKAIRRGTANVNDVKRQLTRTSEDCGSWRVDVSGRLVLCLFRYTRIVIVTRSSAINTNI